MDTPPVQFSPTWNVLGPFQIGTREAPWGADPLEYHGGFTTLHPHQDATFPSSLTRDGRARWSQKQLQSAHTTHRGAKATLHVAFDEDTVLWPRLQQVYGWAATQWQAWARGEIVVGGEGERRVLLWTEGVLEFLVDGERSFGGDLFSFRRAPVVLVLSPGRHVVEVRLVRDVRAMGGVGVPSIEVGLEVAVVEPGLHVGQTLVSDVVDGGFAAPYASVTVTNTAAEWLKVSVASSNNTVLRVNAFDRHLQHPLTLAPGQTLAIPFELTLLDAKTAKADIVVSYHASHSEYEQKAQSVNVPFTFNHASRYSPHKLTHLHQSGIVAYSVLRPPSKNATCLSDIKAAPVMLILHGAGVNADNPVVSESFDSLPDLCAWVLMPNGVTSWSGDDWHTWGFTDALNAVAALPTWTKRHDWQGVGVDTEKLFVAGHSNGGQGTWYALTHYPQKIVAAAPLSGYLSIPLYVPTTFWRPADPSKRAAVEFAISSYRNELFAENFAHIPIYQQHGELDDNVPAFHSSLMYQLINETGTGSRYDVVKGRGHWWTGVATEPGLSEFYKEMLRNPKVGRLADVDEFELVVADPGEMSGRYGVKVLYLQQQGRLGRLKVSRGRDKDVWRFVPDNIMAFEISDDSEIGNIVVDGLQMQRGTDDIPQNTTRIFWLDQQTHSWVITRDPPTPPTRAWNHFGGLNAILRITGQSFVIHALSEQLGPLAVQVSRNLHTYYAAEGLVVLGKQIDQCSATGYKITLAVGGDMPLMDLKLSNVMDFPIKLSNDGPAQLEMRDKSRGWYRAVHENEPLGAIFLRPSKKHGLELVVWGSTMEMTEQAARLVPLITGVGQPDWIVCKKEMMWKGLDGCSVGWFDAWWQIVV